MISFEQHIELQVKFDLVSVENRQIKLQLEEQNDVAAHNEKLTTELDSEKAKYKQACSQILEKNEKIKSMETQITNLQSATSVEVVNLGQAEIGKLKSEINILNIAIRKLQNENNSLKDDIQESTESFVKSEEENSRLEEENTAYQHEVEQLKEMLQDVSIYRFQLK